MSRQFSYELDERQIRILLQDGELEYDVTAWNRFEQTVKPEPRSHLTSFTPKLNLNISRSVIVPALFIILIGGLSAMLFSFVDFKKKEEAVNIVQPEPILKPEPAKTSSIVKSSIPVNKAPAVVTIAKPEKIVAKEPVKIIENKPVITPPVPIKKEQKQVVTASIKEKVIDTKPKEDLLIVNNEPKKEPIPVVKRKRRKKATSEEIPTINTSSINLNAGNDEPELELK